jgi:hypothetical protein
MIRNLIYSLIIHALIILSFFIGIKTKKIPEKKIKEYYLDIVSIDENPILEKIDTTEIKNSDGEKDNPDTSKQKEKVEPKVKEVIKEKKTTSEKIEKTKTIQSNKASEKLEKYVAEKKEIPIQKIDNILSETKSEQETKKEENIDNSNKYVELKNPKDSEELKPNLEGKGLSAREKNNIQSQLTSCYRKAILESKEKTDLGFIIKIEINENGYIKTNIDDLIDKEKYNNPDEKKYRTLINNIKRTFDLCNHIRNLPVEKYDIWKIIILKFDNIIPF